MPTPRANSATKLAAMLSRNAMALDAKYGTSGIAAPMVNARNEPNPAEAMPDRTLVHPTSSKMSKRVASSGRSKIRRRTAVPPSGSNPRPSIDVGRVLLLLLGRLAELEALEFELIVEQLALRLD